MLAVRTRALSRLAVVVVGLCVLMADRTPPSVWAQTAACSASPDPFYLSFPLRNRTAYSVLLNSVFDHSLGVPYSISNEVVAFSGESAGYNGTAASRDLVPGPPSSWGYQNNVPFVLTGQWDGGGNPRFLYYDGHDGWDFDTGDQGGAIDVLAAADGRVTCPGTVTSEIDHGNVGPGGARVQTRYLHMTARVCGADVTRGQRIGTAGAVGTGQVHLHFSVLVNGVLVDPYGWRGQYPDPHTGRSTNLWKPKAVAACHTRRHPDGAVITNGAAHWLIERGTKREFPSEAVFNAYGLDFKDAIIVPSEQLGCIPNGPAMNMPPSPRLRIDNGVVYEITDRGFKRGFPSMVILRGQGFRLEDAQVANVSAFPNDPAVPVYNTPYRDGALLCELQATGTTRQCRPGATVYVVSNSRRLAFASEPAFRALGYRFEDAMPIPIATLDAIPLSTEVISDAWVSSCLQGTQPPSAPGMLGPSGTVASNMPTFTWTKVTGATSYYLYVDFNGSALIRRWLTAGEALCPEGGGNSTCGYTGGQLLNGSGRSWVLASNSAGVSPWSTGLDFTVSLARAPAAPTLTSPIGVTASTTPTYQFRSAAGATWYRVFVTDVTGTRVDQWYTATQAGCSGGTGTCSVTPTAPLTPGQGYWWVLAWNVQGNSPWSARGDFTITGPPPGAATLVSPTGSISVTAPTYRWNAVPGASWYYLWINDSTGNRWREWYTAAAAGCAAGGTCVIAAPVRLTSGPARWWVQTWNAAGHGPWSGAMSFTVP
jgi:murein DD-endopeptidase MepM/ murein hydrolase activator NlpD